MMDMNAEMKKRVEEIERMLGEYLPEAKGPQKTVIEAMNYSIQAGGKRLRPMLMRETYRLFDGQSPAIGPFMAAIEMIHTYSLVHDDLPAMDNDEYRRGKKTTHIVYGEAMAILAGDGLLNYAFETAAKAFGMDTGNANVGRALGILASKAGIYGMIGGQAVDVEREGEPLSKEMLEFIHIHKTSALLEASMLIGAVLAGAGESDQACVEQAARKIGLAFQIQDDILDVVSTTEELGKPVGSDARNEKTTYAGLYGIEQASKEVKRLSAEALADLRSLPGKNEFLCQLIEAMAERKK